MIGSALYILLAPLAAFLVVIFFGKRLPRGGDWVSLFAIWSGVAVSLYLLATRVLVAYDPHFSETFQFDWIVWGDFHLSAGILLDNMSVVMLVVVTLVSAVVHLFSVGYMHGDPRYGLFFAYLSFFSFSMLGLVLADNLIVIYAFWELVGLSSYLLIGFWYEKDSASNAAKKAFITNRVGDAGMLIGILLVLSTLGTVSLHGLAEGVAAGTLSGGLLTATGICLFMGAVGKSAQFPLHVWLPDAMEGPTPVSALIHAATMVAAGVYLVARLFVVLSFDASLVIAYVGGFTALFAATIAVAQNDIKRVLAYSTLSQLGYMIMALGAGAYTAGFFHLVTHAMFKACLFLGSGSVIHAMHTALHGIGSHADAQDLRNMGGLRRKMPLTFWTFLISTVALSGVPLTSGFLSKDAILAGTLAFASEHPAHWLLPVFGFSAAALTAFYMFRLVYLAFSGTFRMGPQAEHHLHESPRVMTVPLMILAVLCFFGFYSLPAFNPTTPEGGWFAHLFPTPPRAYEVVHSTAAALHGHEMTSATMHAAAGAQGAHTAGNHHAAHNTAMLISIIVAGLGILIATMGYYWKRISPALWQRRLGFVYRGMFRKWWVDEIYDVTVVWGTLGLTRLLAWFDLKVIDGLVDGSAWLTRGWSQISGWFDLYVVDGLVNFTAWFVGIWGKFARLFQGGQLQRYFLYTLVALSLLIFLSVFRSLS
ncbi:NADH-quinone oxidoreductase subunit L [bacterium]|nr:NADH-quinone oxidoreductase subunit L [bacterium]MBU1985327.1 NADH-quinone oxidoreductase subunit L [bacterium]